MNLGELLDELRSGLLRDVSNLVEGATDYLWSDQQLVRYINEAHRRFAVRSECLRDGSTPQCCQFTTVNGQGLYPLDKSVISVLSVQMTGDKADLARAGHVQFNTYRQPDTYFFDPSQLSTLPAGKAVAYSTDEGMASDDYGSWRCVILRLYPVIATPYDGIVGNMRVVRYPLVPLTYNNLDAIPEVPEDYHLNLLDWAGYLALRSPDLDIAGGDARGLAKQLAASFEQHCQDAKKIAQRKNLTQPLWGFGQNGWTYTTV